MSNLSTGTTINEFLDLFLEEGDFPEPVQMAQDTRMQGADLRDHAFPKHQGLFSGFAVWLGSSEQPVWRVVDVRWSFPTSEKAIAYYKETLEANSEGHPPVRNAIPIGQQSHVFGGTEPNPLAPDMMMTAYFYIFQVHNIVVKLFVMQGPDAVGTQLTVKTVSTIAQRIESRISERAY